MTGIYCIENQINGKRYVGLAKDVEARWKHHQAMLRGGRHINRHLQAAWKKYGEAAFRFYILEEVECDGLKVAEMEWIKRLDTFNNGYNLTAGGDGQSGRLLTQEERHHLSVINTGQNNPNYGIKRSAATRQRMSSAMRGTMHGPMPEAQKAAISRGNKGKPRPWLNKAVLWLEADRVFESVSAAAAQTGYDLSSISKVCRGDRKSLHKQHFIFVEDNK